jgi:hypothetical protein
MAKGKKTGGRRKSGLHTCTLRLTGTFEELSETRRLFEMRAHMDGIPVSRATVAIILSTAQRVGNYA